MVVEIRKPAPVVLVQTNKQRRSVFPQLELARETYYIAENQRRPKTLVPAGNWLYLFETYGLENKRNTDS